MIAIKLTKPYFLKSLPTVFLHFQYELLLLCKLLSERTYKTRIHMHSDSIQKIPCVLYELWSTYPSECCNLMFSAEHILLANFARARNISKNT